VANSASGSTTTLVRFLGEEANWMAAGRSQNRTGTPTFSAYWIACHSGLNTANGQNAAFEVSSVA
jgi:hypothetical protein